MFTFHKKFKCIRYFLDLISFLNLGILCADKRVVSGVEFIILNFFQLLNTVMKNVFVKALQSPLLFIHFFSMFNVSMQLHAFIKGYKKNVSFSNIIYYVTLEALISEDFNYKELS